MAYRLFSHNSRARPDLELKIIYLSLKESLQNSSLRYPQGIKKRSDEAIFKYLKFNIKIASLRSQ
jgi:hypothetical protein